MRGSQDRDQGVSGLGASRTLAARDAECATDAMVKRRGVKGTRQGINMGHLEAGGKGCEGLRHRLSQTLTAHRGVCLSSLPTLLRRGEGVGVFSQPVTAAISKRVRIFSILVHKVLQKLSRAPRLKYGC